MRAFLVALILLTSVKAYADSFIDDRLNGLNTSTPVSGGWDGFTIAPEQWVGPRFTLPEQTRITEIGGFVFGRLPFVVSILPQINGPPDISTTLATLTLSNNFPTGTMAFESVSPNLLLGAGTYYAIFKPHTAELGEGGGAIVKHPDRRRAGFVQRGARADRIDTYSSGRSSGLSWGGACRSPYGRSFSSRTCDDESVGDRSDFSDVVAFQGSQDEKIMDSMIHAFAVTSLFFLSCVRG